jgi:hypothetical protein
MRRNLPTIYAVLSLIDKSEKSGGAIFNDEYLNDPDNEGDKEILSLLVQSKLTTTATSSLDPFKTYHITWKGHCFLDLFDIWGKECQRNNFSIETLIAEIALKSFC